MKTRDNIFIEALRKEAERARKKFPSSDYMLTALMGEVGELAQALLELQAEGGGDRQEVFKEAVQVATTAMRMATEGDPACFPSYDFADLDLTKIHHAPPKQDALDRAMEMMEQPRIGLPPRALAYASHLCRELGMCGEVLITAYAHYAQHVESLPCADPAYHINPAGTQWFQERK